MYLKSPSLILAVFILNSINCEKCDVHDQECITLALRRMYPIIVAGNASLGVEPSDPLQKDVIEAYLPGLNYTLTDTKMYGYSNCNIREARFPLEDSVWHIFLDCPYLEIKMDYSIDGFIAAEKLMGKGKANITFKKYEISLNGGLQRETRENNKVYIQLIDFDLIRLEVIDKIIFQFNNLFYDDEERSTKMNKFINDHWQEFNSLAQYPAMKAHMSVMIDHFNQYFKKVPVDEIFTQI